MSLIEQKKAFMDTLQRLLDARSAEIERKVAEFRESLEKEKLTDEMKQLVAFINQLDAMIAFEKQQAATATEEVVEDTVENEIEEDVAEEELFEDSENVDEEETFSEDNVEDEEVEDEQEQEIAEDEKDTVAYANSLIGTGFEALQADADDTRAKLRAAEQARPGMPNIVPPRR